MLSSDVSRSVLFQLWPLPSGLHNMHIIRNVGVHTFLFDGMPTNAHQFSSRHIIMIRPLFFCPSVETSLPVLSVFLLLSYCNVMFHFMRIWTCLHSILDPERTIQDRKFWIKNFWWNVGTLVQYFVAALFFLNIQAPKEASRTQFTLLMVSCRHSYASVYTDKK
jgi:hypothetical protein